MFEKERSSGSSSGFADDGFPTLFADVLKMADEMDGEDEDFIWEGVEMNDRIAAEGIKPAGGGSLQSSNFGLILRNDEKVGDFVPVALEIRTTASAAAEARMSGVQLPVMSSAGSGNHGITAIIPIAVLGRREGKSRREIAKAIAVSHLATSFVKRNSDASRPSAAARSPRARARLLHDLPHGRHIRPDMQRDEPCCFPTSRECSATARRRAAR